MYNMQRTWDTRGSHPAAFDRASHYPPVLVSRFTSLVGSTVETDSTDFIGLRGNLLITWRDSDEAYLLRDTRRP